MTQPTPPEQKPVDYATKRDLLHDRRALAMIGGGLVVVAAIGLFVVKPMLSGSSNSSDTGAVASAHVHPASVASPTPSVTPSAAPTAAPALDVRDPFSPLYSPPAGSGGSGATASPSPSAGTTGTAGAAGTAGATVTTIVVPGPTVTRTVAPPAKPKYTLVFTKIVSASTQTIQVQLNGVAYTLSPSHRLFPDAVNGPFELTALVTSINGTAEADGPATFMYGDASFSMLVGETQLEN
jgi:hypothetical protein